MQNLCQFVFSPIATSAACTAANSLFYGIVRCLSVRSTLISYMLSYKGLNPNHDF